MNKLERDGKVAVIYHPRYGAGWYSWHGVDELLFDPVVAQMVEADADSENIIAYCEKAYPAALHLFAEDLEIEWIPIGSEFIIDEYDGSETIRLKDEFSWLVA